jgi:hypothetical protein
MTIEQLLAELADTPSDAALSAARALMPSEAEQNRLGIRRVRALTHGEIVNGVVDWTDRPGTAFQAKSRDAAMLGAVIKAIHLRTQSPS